MNFNSEKFNRILQELKYSFGERCKQMLPELMDMGFSDALRLLCGSPNPFRIDLEKGLDRIDQILNKSSNGEYVPSNSAKFEYDRNTICFERIAPDIPDYGTKEYESWVIGSQDLLMTEFENYWKDPNRNAVFSRISKFRIYENPVLPSHEEYMLTNSLPKINFDEWNNFIIEIIRNFLGNHFPIESINRTRIEFKKFIMDGVVLGLGYNKSSLSRECKRNLDLPELYLFVEIMDSYPKKKSSRVDLGIANNPFFSPPIVSLPGFRIWDNEYRLDKVRQTYRFNYPIIYVNRDDGTTEKVFSLKQQERLKKYAYYYMEAFSLTSEPYISYIENALTKSL